MKPNPQPNQDTTVDDVEQLLLKFATDMSLNITDGHLDLGKAIPADYDTSEMLVGWATSFEQYIQAHYARKQLDQLQQIANANYDDMHQTYDYDGIAEMVLDTLNKEVRE